MTLFSIVQSRTLSSINWYRSGCENFRLVPSKPSSLLAAVQSQAGPLPFYLPRSRNGGDAIYDEDPADSAAAAALADARFLSSPCLPFCCGCRPSANRCFVAAPFPFLQLGSLTSHLANRSSISPRRSATSLFSSFRLRRTTRPATAT